MTQIETKQSQLTITYVPISALRPDPKNPRCHSDRQVKQIAKSIESFGFNVPVLIDESFTILAGHGRVLASQKLGWGEVPTIRLAHLTSAQARAFNIADNRLTDTSEWDEKLLAENLSDLALLDLDFDIESVGFTLGEIDLKIEGLSVQDKQPADEADQFAAATGPSVTMMGDLWHLGKHRLYCGDALSAESYSTLMQGKQASLIFIDPPYNVPIDGHCVGLGGTKHREFAMAAGEMSQEEFTKFLSKSFALLVGNSVAGSIHFVCMDWRHAHEVLTAGKQVYTEVKNICVWTKDNGGMGSLYRSQHELVFVFKHGNKKHHNNVELGKHGRYRTNVWDYPGANSFSRKGEEGDLLALHPTVKPVALIADAILDCSARGDIVLDVFVGSGSTILAAERVGRRCYAMELDPLYIDTAIRRWQKWTGEQAIHVASGKTFNALAEQGGRHD